MPDRSPTRPSADRLDEEIHESAAAPQYDDIATTRSNPHNCTGRGRRSTC